MHRNPVIAHISDLHFGHGNHNLQASTDLKRAILEGSPLPDFLVVTGDLTQWGNRETMNQVRQYLLELLNEIWRRYTHPARCIVVPGNHDLLPTAWKGRFWVRDRLADWNSVFPAWAFTVGPSGDADCPVEPATLNEFYQRQEQTTPGLDTETIRRRAEARAREALRVCEYFPHFQIAFVKIDSNKRRTWRPTGVSKGYTGEEQLSQIERVLKDYTEAFPSTAEADGFAEARRIALVHHHLHFLPGVRHEDLMLMEDAGTVWQRLALLNFHLILHGHRHQASQAGLSYWDAGRERRTNVLAAGSASAMDADDGRNSYYQIRVGCFRTEVRRPEFPPQLENGRFTEPENSPVISFQRPFDLAVPAEIQAPLHLEALKESLLVDDEFPDEAHDYDLIDFTGIIDDLRNYWGLYVLQGRNVSPKDTGHIPFSLAAVGAHKFEDLQVEARDLDRNQLIPGLRPERLRPINAFPLRIPFLDPLPAGQPFKIQLSFRLPQVMHEQDDYDLMNFVRFRRGVRRVIHRLLSTRKISEPKYWAVKGDRVVPTGITPKPSTSDKFPLPGPSGVQPVPVSGYEVRVDNPRVMSYLFYYKRLL